MVMFLLSTDKEYIGNTFYVYNFVNVGRKYWILAKHDMQQVKVLHNMLWGKCYAVYSQW